MLIVLIVLSNRRLCSSLKLPNNEVNKESRERNDRDIKLTSNALVI